VALLWQAWALAGHGRESVRFVTIRLTPLLFFVIAFLVTGAAAIRTLAQDTNIGRGVAFGCAALFDLFLVTFMARLAIHAGLESKEGGPGHGTLPAAGCLT
jgi:succinate dehydrogenase/fumarate reductase cytochrome b subunit